MAARDLAAHFNGFLDGAQDHVVAGTHDAQVGGGDVLVFMNDLQEFFLVDRQNALAVACVIAELDVGDVEGSDFKFHNRNHSFEKLGNNASPASMDFGALIKRAQAPADRPFLISSASMAGL